MTRTPLDLLMTPNELRQAMGMQKIEDNDYTKHIHNEYECEFMSYNDFMSEIHNNEKQFIDMNASNVHIPMTDEEIGKAIGKRIIELYCSSNNTISDTE